MQPLKPCNLPSSKIIQNTTAIFLAAGSSRRMGARNKLLLPYQGQALVAHTYQQLYQSEIENIVLVTGFEQERITQALQAFQPHIIYNEQHLTGMTSSIQVAVQHLPTSTKAFMVCLADMPFLTSTDYNQLLQTFQQHFHDQALIIQPCVNGRPGNPIIFSHHFRTAILAHQQPEGCKEIVQQNKSVLISVSLDNPLIFNDIDTALDYEKVLENS